MEISLEAQLKNLVTEVCEQEGFQLYDLELASNNKILRVFLDKSEGGVNLDECALLSRALDLVLDSEDLFAGAYNLEVSSPGLERNLREPWHFEEQLNKEIKVVLKARTSSASKIGRKQIVGELTQVNESGILIKEDIEGHEIPYQDIHRANLIFDYERNFGKNLKGL